MIIYYIHYKIRNIFVKIQSIALHSIDNSKVSFLSHCYCCYHYYYYSSIATKHTLIKRNCSEQIILIWHYELLSVYTYHLLGTKMCYAEASLNQNVQVLHGLGYVAFYLYVPQSIKYFTFQKSNSNLEYRSVSLWKINNDAYLGITRIKVI